MVRRDGDSVTAPVDSARGALLEALRTGARLEARDGQLVLQRDRRPATRIVEALSAHKSGVLELLGPRQYPSARYRLLTNGGDVADILPELLRSQRIGFDIETMPKALYADRQNAALSPQLGQVRLVQLCAEGPADQRSDVLLIDALHVDLHALAPLFGETGPSLVGHNVGFDVGFLVAAGLPMPPGRRLFDTFIAARLMDSGEADYFPPEGLDDLVWRQQRLYLPKTGQTADWAAMALLDAQLSYAATDVWATLDVARQQRDELQAAGMVGVFRLEMRALPAAIRMRLDGAPFDANVWLPLAESNRQQLARTTAELLDGYVNGADFNPRSRQQVLELLHERGHQPGRWQYEEWKDSTDAAALRELRLESDDPLLEVLQRWRKQATFDSRCGPEFPSDYVMPDGRIHGDFKPLGTACGRATCSDPNLLQIPRRGAGSAYRRAFRAPPGRVIVHADYSQIQLRLGADQARDRVLIDAYRRGEDVHRLTASRLFGRSIEQVDDRLRDVGKTCGLALEFGMGHKLLRSKLLEAGTPVTEAEAERLHRAFHATYVGLHRWQRSFADGPLELRTPIGRRRLDVRKFTEKPNSMCQMLEVDGQKQALALLGECWAAYMPRTAKLALLVYDEVDIECDVADAASVAELLREVMVNGMQSMLERVPVVVDTSVGVDWAGTPLDGAEPTA
jgi:DNA polymerase I